MRERRKITFYSVAGEWPCFASLVISDVDVNLLAQGVLLILVFFPGLLAWAGGRRGLGLLRLRRLVDFFLLLLLL